MALTTEYPISWLWGKKRRRAYKATQLEIKPYSKKPKIAAFSVSSLKEIRSLKLPESLKDAR